MKAAVFHQTRQMSEQQLLPPGTSCPFCSSTNRKKVAVLQEAPDVHLLLCTNCHAASASRMPTSQALDDYYQSYYSDDVAEKVTFDTPDKIASHIFSFARKMIGPRISAGQGVNILDFGGGDACISRAVAEKMLAAGATDSDIALVEYNAKPKQSANSKITIHPANTIGELKEGPFPLVIASAVIEHIPEPAETIKALLANMEIGGIMYVRTPCMLPFLKIAEQFGKRFDFTYPAHLHDLGSRFWSNITKTMELSGEYEIVCSQPSIVETSFKQHFLRTLLAYTLKAPGFVFKEGYDLVGGWEVVIKRKS